VLFAQWPDTITPAATDPEWPDANYLWLPQASGRTALVIDLPAVESVRTGIAFARRGYRRCRCSTRATGHRRHRDRTADAGACQRRRYLKTFSIVPTAPPAFLLDADRMQPPRHPPREVRQSLGRVPAGFPVGDAARGARVSDVLLIHDRKSVQEDLAHVLLRWQQGGLRLMQASPSDSSTSELTVARPSWFRRAWYRALTASRLRRNNAEALARSFRSSQAEAAAGTTVTVRIRARLTSYPLRSA
jgi:hypothetical protein